MLRFQILLIAVLISCLAFVSCDRAQQVMTPVTDDMMQEGTPSDDMMDDGMTDGMDDGMTDGMTDGMDDGMDDGMTDGMDDDDDDDDDTN